MTDYLLKFPDKETAVQVGQLLGFTNEEGTETLPANEELAILVIGEFLPDGWEGESPPEDWWVLVRLLEEKEIPIQMQDFISWRSDLVDNDGNKIPRDSSMPSNQWL